MAKYKYVENKDENDGTTQVKINDKVLDKGGDSVDLTEEESAKLEKRFVLEKDSSPGPAKKSSSNSSSDGEKKQPVTEDVARSAPKIDESVNPNKE